MKVLLNKWLLSFLILCVVMVGAVSTQNSMMSKKASAAGNSKTAAVVNGESIMKEQLFNEMYKMDGQKVLDGLINKKLLEQEAKKLNLKAADEEINKEIDKIKNNLGNNYKNALADSHLTEKELEENIALGIVQKKMFSDQATVSEKELNDFLSKLPKEEQAKQKEKVKEMIQKQKLQQEAQKWLKEARAKADIQIQM